jgi:hypothetical protein
VEECRRFWALVVRPLDEVAVEAEAETAASGGSSFRTACRMEELTHSSRRLSSATHGCEPRAATGGLCPTHGPSSAGRTLSLPEAASLGQQMALLASSGRREAAERPLRRPRLRRKFHGRESSIVRRPGGPPRACGMFHRQEIDLVLRRGAGGGRNGLVTHGRIRRPTEREPASQQTLY